MKRDGVTIGRYYYDGEGKRIKKVTDTETTIFVYSAGKLIAEYSTALSQTPSINYTTTDHLGSPRVITNALVQITSRRDFLPFGEEIYESIGGRTSALGYGSSGDAVRQKFTGYQKDTETSLDFAEARMYENRHGRFTAVDPLLASGKSANPQTFNRYVYVGDNPLTRTDPTGLDWYRRQIKDSQQYEYEWFAKDPGDGWGAVNFGFFGQYTTFTNACINGTCGGTGYLYRDGGADFGERAARINAYGFGDALKDTGIGTAQFGWNTMAFATNSFYRALEQPSPFAGSWDPSRIIYRRSYWEPENQVQANANLAWTILSLYGGGAGATRRLMFAQPGFGVSTAATPARVIQYEQYALLARKDGFYPVMQRGFKEPVGTVFLKEGDLWKYGETMNPATRYSGRFLKNTGSGLRFSVEFKTPSFKEAFQMQKQKIIDYEIRFGRKPPGNKIRG